MKTPALIACTLLFAVGCSTPPTPGATPETDDEDDAGDYATPLPAMPKHVPKYPWEPGYRPPEEIEIERAQRPQRHVVSEEVLYRAALSIRYPAIEAAAAEQKRRDDAARFLQQNSSDEEQRRKKKDGK